MAQITTTNRMAILDLIAQADETVEVNGLSMSVSQLQVDVMSLSASVAGLTGGGGSYTYVDENTTDKTFKISITGSTIYDEVLLDPDQVIGNTRIKSVNVADNTQYSEFTSTYDNPSWNVYTSTNNSSISLSPNDVILNSSGSDNTSFSLDGNTGEIITTINNKDTPNSNVLTDNISSSSRLITDGTYTTTNYIAPDNSYTEVIGEGNTSSVSVSAVQILNSITDGTSISTINMVPNQIALTVNDGTNITTINQQTSFLISSGDGVSVAEATIDHLNGSTITQYDATDTSLVEIYTSYIGTSTTDGVDLSSVTQTKNSYNITTPTTLYNAQSNGDLEIRADGNLTIVGDYQNNQTSINIQANQLSFDISLAGILNIVGLPSFDDDAAAGTGGLVAGNVYQTTGGGASPLDVAGILMIKQ